MSENQHNTPLTTSEPPWTLLLNCYIVKIKTTLKTWLSLFTTPAVCIHDFPLSHCTFQKQAQAASLSNSEKLDDEDQVHCAEYHQVIPFWQGNILFTEELLYPRNTPASWGRVRRNYRQKAGKYSHFPSYSSYSPDNMKNLHPACGLCFTLTLDIEGIFMWSTFTSNLGMVLLWLGPLMSYVADGDVFPEDNIKWVILDSGASH